MLRSHESVFVCHYAILEPKSASHVVNVSVSNKATNKHMTTQTVLRNTDSRSLLHRFLAATCGHRHRGWALSQAPLHLRMLPQAHVSNFQNTNKLILTCSANDIPSFGRTGNSNSHLDKCGPHRPLSGNSNNQQLGDWRRQTENKRDPLVQHSTRLHFSHGTWIQCLMTCKPSQQRLNSHGWSLLHVRPQCKTRTTPTGRRDALISSRV